MSQFKNITFPLDNIFFLHQLANIQQKIHSATSVHRELTENTKPFKTAVVRCMHASSSRINFRNKGTIFLTQK